MVRRNLPATSTELDLEDDIRLLSQTDVHGRITSFSDRFVDISGFAPGDGYGHRYRPG